MDGIGLEHQLRRRPLIGAYIPLRLEPQCVCLSDHGASWRRSRLHACIYHRRADHLNSSNLFNPGGCFFSIALDQQASVYGLNRSHYTSCQGQHSLFGRRPMTFAIAFNGSWPAKKKHDLLYTTFVIHEGMKVDSVSQMGGMK